MAASAPLRKNSMSGSRSSAGASRELRTNFGVRLFERSTAGGRLTLLGEDFVVDAHRHLSSWLIVLANNTILPLPAK